MTNCNRFAGDDNVALGAAAVAHFMPKQCTLLPSGGINVTDQAGYEASGVEKVRDGIKALGGKLIAGGYNKAIAVDKRYPRSQSLSDLRVCETRRLRDKAQAEIDQADGRYEGERANDTDRYRVFEWMEGMEQEVNGCKTAGANQRDPGF